MEKEKNSLVSEKYVITKNRTLCLFACYLYISTESRSQIYKRDLAEIATLRNHGMLT